MPKRSFIKKNKFCKKFFLFIFSIIFSLLVLLVLFLFAENKYFDQLFFQKSALHGYGNWDFTDSNKNEQSSFLIKHRAKDSYYLLDIENKYFQKAKENEFKIAVIGDSYTYGLGIRENQRFSNLLEKKLDKIYPTKVYNFSVPGENLIHHYIKYQLIREKLDVDFFIFSIAENDLDFWEIFHDYGNFYQQLDYLKQDCKPLLFGHCEENQFNWFFYIANYFYPQSNAELYGNMCVAGKVLDFFPVDRSLIIFTQPRVEPNQCVEEITRETDYFQDIILDSLSTLSLEKGFKTIDFYQKFVDDGNDLSKIVVTKNETHFSAYAHRFYAELLYNELINIIPDEYRKQK